MLLLFDNFVEFMSSRVRNVKRGKKEQRVYISAAGREGQHACMLTLWGPPPPVIPHSPLPSTLRPETCAL